MNKESKIMLILAFIIPFFCLAIIGLSMLLIQYLT